MHKIKKEIAALIFQAPIPRLTILWALFLAGAAFAESPASSDSRTQAVVQTIVGMAQARFPEDSAWVELRVGMRLSDGDQVRTFEESSVELVWADGGMLKVTENGYVAISCSADLADNQSHAWAGF